MTSRGCARLLALVLVVGCGDGESTARIHVASASCPLKTPADWQAFMDSALDDPTWVKTCSDLSDCDTSVGPFADHVRTHIAGTFEACVDDIRDNPPIARCSERLRRFAPAWLRQHSVDSYGFDQENADYFAAQVGANQPSGMMELPPAMLAALPLRKTIEQTAREQGWPYLTHDSCLGGTRTFVTVADRDGRFDQWFLFGLDESASKVESSSIVSFIAVQKKDAVGNALARVRLHFRDYRVTLSADQWVIDLPENGPGKCYACHGSGVRQLLSNKGSVLASAPVLGEPDYGAPIADDFAQQRLRSLNDELLAYGVADWTGSLAPDDHGPPLGNGLGCTSCHDGETRGVLTVHTSEGMLWQKVVGQLSMQAPTVNRVVPDAPAMQLLEREQQGDALTEEEALELEQARSRHVADYESLVANRFPALRDWALAVSCE